MSPNFVFAVFVVGWVTFQPRLSHPCTNSKICVPGHIEGTPTPLTRMHTNSPVSTWMFSCLLEKKNVILWRAALKLRGSVFFCNPLLLVCLLQMNSSKKVNLLRLTAVTLKPQFPQLNIQIHTFEVKNMVLVLTSLDPNFWYFIFKLILSSNWLVFTSLCY